MNKIFHIPHSSTHIPKEYIGTFMISEKELYDEISIMCDTRTDEMIDSEDKIVFPYSRILCDVERFNSEQEIMNKVGMGVIYYKTHNLNPMRAKLPDKIYKELIGFYDEHHKKLNDVCEEKLKDGDVLFIDLHSYSNTPLRYELYKDKKRPNICLGINDRFNEEILDKIISIVERFGYTYSINEPFSGCLLPSNYIDDERVHGVMIEINKLIYSSVHDFEKVKDFLKCIKKEV